MTNSEDQKSKVNFMLRPDWILQPPIDFEHKKYILLSFLQKCEEKLSIGEIYPYFIELSLHFANAQVFEKENKILYTDKVFKGPDDELLITELKSLPIPDFSPIENLELIKINKYFGLRVYEFFSIAKSIWSLAFESTNIVCKKNKENIKSDKGFMFYKNTFNKRIYVWEYIIENQVLGKENKCTINLIFDSDVTVKRITTVLKQHATFNIDISALPLFELKCSQNFPIINTLAPIFKRRLMNYLYQRIGKEEFNDILIGE